MKSERLFEMLLYLINVKQTNAGELAKKFGVSIRTIYRDVDSLSLAGIPIYTTSGNNGGIHLMDDFSAKNSLFSDKEMKDILFSIKTLDSLPFFSADSALTKIGTHISKENSNDQWMEIDFSHWGDGSLINEKHFEIIKNSIINTKQVEISYYGLNGQFTIRTVEPLKLLFQQKDWYLYAFSIEKSDFRFFKLTRISNVKQLANRSIHDYRDYSAKDSISTKQSLKNQIEVVAIFDPELAYLVFDRLPTAKFERISDNRLKATAQLSDDEWLVSFFLSFGSKVRIISPQSLSDKIKKIHKEASI